MWRWLITATLLGIGTMGSIIYIAKPEVIDGNIRDIRAPIDRMIQEHKDSKWKAAREKAWADWSGRHPAAQDCIHPRSALKTTECKNQADINANNFEITWQQRLASGWQPE